MFLYCLYLCLLWESFVCKSQMKIIKEKLQHSQFIQCM